MFGVLMILIYWITWLSFDRDLPSTWIKLAAVAWLTGLSYVVVAHHGLAILWLLVGVANLVTSRIHTRNL